MNIYNTNAWDELVKLRNNSVDVIITDPDYNHDINMDELRRVCRGHIIMFAKPENIWFSPDEQAYWVKPTSTKNNSKHLSRFVELILIERHGDVFNPGLHWSNYTGVYNDTIVGKQIHPWQKPLSLMERLVLIYSRPGDLILDPFAGVGTTLVAAEKHGRRSLGYEINPEYFKLALGNSLIE